MQSTVSASKGVFVFKNGIKAVKKSERRRLKHRVQSSNIFSDKLWYESFNESWQNIQANMQTLSDDMFARVLGDLVSFVKKAYELEVTEIPTAVLLTGINMPDHEAQFNALAREVSGQVTEHVVILNSQNCQTMKYLIGTMVSQFIWGSDAMSDCDCGEASEKQRIKKLNLNFSVLQAWYVEKCLQARQKKPLVIILADFEGFPEHVLQNTVLILSSYINVLPFILIFGLATSVNVLHKALPFHVSSKVNMQMFHSQPSISYLNNVIEDVFFSDECMFNLGAKVFSLFTDVFLFYDFSVTGFIKNFQYAMLEHYSTGNAKAFCKHEDDVEDILNRFTKQDYENVRQLVSFRKFVEANNSYEKRIKLLCNDEYLGSVLEEEIPKLFDYIHTFRICLKVLQFLVGDLPKSPCGRQIREIYNLAVSRTITKTPQYRECMQLLNFQSADELVPRIISTLGVLKKYLKSKNFVANEELLACMVSIEAYFEIFQIVIQSDDMNVDDNPQVEYPQKKNENIVLESNMDRAQLKQRLLTMSKTPTRKSIRLNRYEKARQDIVGSLSRLFETFLIVPSELPFHEIFFFNDISIQQNVIGTHRAAIHTALNDPHSYLQCSCCQLPNNSVVLSTMPDISIAYKLHLEYGKMINLYDWLQAFHCVLTPRIASTDDAADDDENYKQTVDKLVQARFTQCVAELEYLGFVKSSKRKLDHVTRLTWGG